MSGRSAYVRKEKTKVKNGVSVLLDGSSAPSLPSLREFPVPMSSKPIQFPQEMPYRKPASDHATIRSHSSDRSDDFAYARVRKPPMPVIDVSGIEKSSFRTLMDKKSEGVRKGLAKTFGGKTKKYDEQRPITAATIRPESHEIDSDPYEAAPATSVPRSRQQQQPTHQQFNQPQYNQQPDYPLPGPPQGKLPPIPQGPQIKRWVGNGRAPQTWNKLRKDPELWDPHGDTLVYIGHTNQGSRPTPSFRISSHVVEGTESRFLVSLLHEGTIEDDSGLSMPPSPISSPISRQAIPAHRGRGQPTPPTSEGSMGEWEGQISYEMYFPVPQGLSREQTLRHQLSTRNVFAILYQVSLVGLNFYHALRDVQDRLETYMPPDHDSVGMMIDYLTDKGMDDVRENPVAAAAMLAWSEDTSVRWEDGWREAFVHAVGMYTRVEGCADYRFISPIARALLERASLELQIRVQDCEKRLANFDFGDMWPMMDSQPPPAQAAFERLKTFFFQHYQNSYQNWPPAAPPGAEQWLTRTLVRKLQTDFGALYDYLVNREVSWDGSQDRGGRKWNIVCPGNVSFDVDTKDLPFTDIIAAFDNRHSYPHIPHPYPLVPESVQVRSNSSSKDNMFKNNNNNNKKLPSKPEDRMAERRAALAYTESTNIYLLGSNFVSNDLVEEYVRFEKNDRASDIDPFAARRGRWVLIYGILQVLGSLAVDTPGMRYTDDIMYHLSPRLKGTPPWRGPTGSMDEASHIGSHCWTVRHKWNPEPPFTIIGNTRRMGIPISVSTRSAALSGSGYSESDTSSSYRSPTSMSVNSRSRRAGNGNAKHRDLLTGDLMSSSGYAPGIEKVGEWPIREENRSIRNTTARSRSRAVSNQGGGDDNQSHAGSLRDRAMDGSRSRAGSVSQRGADKREQMQREFTIKDFESYNFREGTGSLGMSSSLGGDWMGGKSHERG